jgi:hypothetical protein
VLQLPLPPWHSVNGCQLIKGPVALHHTEPALFVPITGPDMLDSVFCENSVPKTLFRVALLICTIPSRRGR